MRRLQQQFFTLGPPDWLKMKNADAPAVKREGEEDWAAMRGAPASGQNRVMIYGPKNDGTYIVEFRTADGEALAISVPASETRVLKHFQKRMPYGLFVPDVDPAMNSHLS